MAYLGLEGGGAGMMVCMLSVFENLTTPPSQYTHRAFKGHQVTFQMTFVLQLEGWWRKVHSVFDAFQAAKARPVNLL